MAVKSQKSDYDGASSKKPNKPANYFLTKVILRRLPPTMTETELIEQISPLPAHDYFLFIPTDTSLAPWNFSRAYINFTSVEDVILFRDRFDGYVFVDNRGSEYPAIVEMAPNVKVPKKKQKRDVKCGSLEDDPEYKKFVEALKNPEPTPTMSLEACLEEIDKKDKERKDSKHVKIPTPLTEFIREKKEEKIRRQLEKKRQKEEDRRKRIEYEKQQEKRRQQREQQQKEREAKKEADRSSVPPRFAAAAAAKEEAKETSEKRKDEMGNKKENFGKKSTWKGSERKQYCDDYYDKPAPKKPEQRPSRFMDQHQAEKKYQATAEYDDDGGTFGAGSGTAKKRYDKPPKEGREKRTDGREFASKTRYKDKPSVPLYQPGSKKKSDEPSKPDQ